MTLLDVGRTPAGSVVIMSQTASRWREPGAAVSLPVASSEERAFDHGARRLRHSRRSIRPRGHPSHSGEWLDHTSMASRPLSPLPSSIRRWVRSSSTPGPCSADESVTTQAIAGLSRPLLPWALFPSEAHHHASLRPGRFRPTGIPPPRRGPPPRWGPAAEEPSVRGMTSISPRRDAASVGCSTSKSGWLSPAHRGPHSRRRGSHPLVGRSSVTRMSRWDNAGTVPTPDQRLNLCFPIAEM